MLDAMPDDPHPVPSGTLGTVTAVDDAGQVHVRWRNGRGLALVPGHDSFHVVQPDHDYVSQLQKKLEQSLAEYKAKWLRKTPEQLIGLADELCAVCMTAEQLSNSVTMEQAEYLLQLKNPLEVVSDCWRETHLTDDMFQREEFGICADNIMNGSYYVCDYEWEVEPEDNAGMEVNMT